jgi:hypothetical protein
MLAGRTATVASRGHESYGLFTETLTASFHLRVLVGAFVLEPTR